MHYRHSHLILILLWLLITFPIQGQVTTIPSILQRGYKGPVTIIFNPNTGNKGMVGAHACYAHTGITIGTSRWQKTGAWRSSAEKYKMTKDTDGNWRLEIHPSIYSYYGVGENTDIRELCFVFNDGPNGSKEGKAAGGKDIFVQLVEPGLTATIDTDIPEISFKGKRYTLHGHSTMDSRLVLKLNHQIIQTVDSGMDIECAVELTQSGDNVILLEAYSGGKSTICTMHTFVPGDPIEEARPTGVSNGIYYRDSTKATVCTYAASKAAPAQCVYVVGDFNKWTLNESYRCKRDGNYFWLELDSLSPGKEYAFQYVVVRSDSAVKRISDLYSEKLLSPDDQYEPRSLDPSLMVYPSKGDEYVSVLQPHKKPYSWSEATLTFKRPDKHNLIIYEMWVYDYTAERSFAGVMNRLDYLQHLGVNAIEFMPLSEFDGNYNWGYSPNHYFALDKAYGTPEQFKQLVDSCHSRGMAVIVDMVFNHATGLNPMNKLYPYGEELQYNPWFNVIPPHNDDFYQDWNHDFLPAREMFIRALRYWLEEYKIDGYRMDLSAGFCGSDCANMVNNIIRYYHEGVQSVSPDAYFILEHWGAGTQQLINEGMMCWTGKGLSDSYANLARGEMSGSSIYDANRDGYIAYNESHDEERNFYRVKTSGPDNLKNWELNRLSRVPAIMAFNTLLDGSHMIWQYGELGYDYSINSTAGSSTISSDNRTSIKERIEGKGWLNEGSIRMKQYERVAQAIQLRTRLLPEVFAGNPTSFNLTASAGNKRTVQWGNDVYVVANFSATDDQAVTLPSGTWYDYYHQSKASGSYTLKPGEVLIFTGKPLALPVIPKGFDVYTDSPAPIPSSQGNTNIKLLIDGRIVIRNGDDYYDIMGRRIE